MNKNTFEGFGRLIVLGISALAMTGAIGATFEKLSPYAFTKVTNDDNIFRSSSNEQDDTISHLGAGIDADLRFGQQHLLLTGLVDHSWYDSFDQLNHTRVDGRGTYQWVSSRQWSGNISYGYNRRLSSFEEQTIRQKDMRTTHDLLASGNYQLNTDWQIGGQLDHTDISHEQRNDLDKDVTGGQVESLYTSTLDTRIGIRLRHAEYDVQDSNINTTIINNDFSETTLSGLLYWEKYGKPSLEARLGFTDIKYDTSDSRDDKGASGRLTYFWLPTGKMRLDLSVWQEVSTLERDSSSYVLSQGYSVKPVWSITSKISLEALVMFSNDDFKGDNELRQLTNAAEREDDVWSYQIGPVWKPRDQVRIKVDYRKKDRDSTVDLRDFTDNQINAELRLTF